MPGPCLHMISLPCQVGPWDLRRQAACPWLLSKQVVNSLLTTDTQTRSLITCFKVTGELAFTPGLLCTIPGIGNTCLCFVFEVQLECSLWKLIFCSQTGWIRTTCYSSPAFFLHRLVILCLCKIIYSIQSSLLGWKWHKNKNCTYFVCFIF